MGRSVRALLIVAAMAASPASADVIDGPYSQPGPHAITVDERLIDGIAIYPRDAGQFPLIVVGTGFLNPPQWEHHLGEHLASWGFVVLIPHDPISQTRTYVETIDRAEQLAASEPLRSRLDLSRVGVRGGSYSGPRAIEAAMDDPRVSAVTSANPAVWFNLRLRRDWTHAAQILLLVGEFDQWGANSVPAIYDRLAGDVYVAQQAGKDHYVDTLDDDAPTAAWFRVMLSGDDPGYFFAPLGTLRADPTWSSYWKGFDE